MTSSSFSKWNGHYRKEKKILRTNIHVSVWMVCDIKSNERDKFPNEHMQAMKGDCEYIS